MVLVLFKNHDSPAFRIGPFNFRVSLLFLNIVPHYWCLYTLMVNFKNKYPMMIFAFPKKAISENLKE